MICIDDNEYEKYVSYKERTYISNVAAAYSKHFADKNRLGYTHASPSYVYESNFIRSLPIEIVRQIHQHYFKEIGFIEY